MVTKRKSFQFILCPRKNPKIQESCKKQSDTSYQRQGQLKNARRNKNRLGFNLPPPLLCFFGFSNGLSISKRHQTSAILENRKIIPSRSIVDPNCGGQ